MTSMAANRSEKQVELGGMVWPNAEIMKYHNTNNGINHTSIRSAEAAAMKFACSIPDPESDAATTTSAG